MEKDWKSAYQELLSQHQMELEERVRLTDTLQRAVIRLTLAASGLDEQLDPHLRAIRDAVRAGVTPAFEAKLNALSDNLMRRSELDEEKVAVQDECSGYSRLIERLRLTSGASGEVERLLDDLRSSPDGLPDTELDRLASLLVHAAGGESKSGFLSRLLGSAQEPRGSGVQPPNQALMELLDQASWPGHWGGEITRFQSRLSEPKGDDEWIEVLKELLELTAGSYGEAQSEIKEAEDFLADLTRRLDELDRFLRFGHENREQGLHSGRKLNLQISAQVNDIQDSMQDQTDLYQLKDEINLRLGEIQQSMDRFLAEEEKRHQAEEANERQLREKMRELEEESSDLRFRMVEAHNLAMVDPLTELPNRLAYQERVEQELARWKRFKEPLSMAIWDVDDFKSINDRFGHQAGDKALRVIARTLQRRHRQTDFIARYGGEEFVTLLSGADAEEALRVADEMREAVASSGFHSGGRSIRVTISCGISEFTGDDTAETVFARADKALYESKHRGKNRCTLA